MRANVAGEQPSPLLKLLHPGSHGPTGWARVRLRLSLPHLNSGLVAILIALALAAPVGLFTEYTYTTVTSELTARTAAERVGSAELAANLVGEVLLGAGEALRQVAARPSLRAALKRRDAAAIADDLGDLRLMTGRITSASAFDARGALLQRDPPAPDFLGRDFSDRDYLRGAMSSPDWFVSNAYVARMPAAVPLASVSLAVRDGQEHLGILSVAIQPSQVISALRPIGGSKGREILIVDGLSQVVASSDPSRQAASVVEISRADRPVTRTSGTTTGKVAGLISILTFAPVPSSLWTIYLIDEPATVLAAEQRLSDQLRLGAGAAALVALAVGILFGLSFRALGIANRRTLESAARQAFTDGLTDLYNRHFMAEQLGLLHGAATRGRRTYSVIAFDADGLKRVNDSYGHEVGDLALRRLAAVVKRNIRAMDIPVRTGGDEFVVILPDTDLAGAARAAQHIVHAAEAERKANPQSALGVSAGVAEWLEGRTADDVLHAADLLLVQAKRSGKGRAISLPDPAYAFL